MPEEALEAKDARAVRALPHDDDAEQSVICAMLMDADAVDYAAENLDRSDFFNQRLGAFFAAAQKLYNDGQEVDIIALKSRLETEGTYTTAEDLRYLAEVAMAVPSSAHIRQHVRIVKEKSMLRRYISLAGKMSEEAYAGEDLDGIQERVEKGVFDILKGRSGEDFQEIADVLHESMQDLKEAAARGSEMAGIPTGLTDLDKRLGGLMKSDMIVVGARPGMGKTSFGLGIVYNLAVRHNKKCAVFSLEMSAKQVANRLVSLSASVPLTNMRTGKLENYWEAITDAMIDISRAPIYIDDTAGLTINELRTKCRKLALEKDGIDFILIDYLQLMSGQGSGDNRQQEVAEISRRIKGLAKELDVPIMALSQLNRSVDKTTGDNRPGLADIRESGAIEQDADIVLFLYRDAKYHEDADPNLAEVIIAKFRNGATDKVKVRFDGEYTRFSNLEYQSQYTE